MLWGGYINANHAIPRPLNPPPNQNKTGARYRAAPNLSPAQTKNNPLFRDRLPAIPNLFRVYSFQRFGGYTPVCQLFPRNSIPIYRLKFHALNPAPARQNKPLDIL